MNNTVEEGKSIAITSYILIVGVLIAMSMNSENKNSFASFHIRQAAGISITFVSLALIVSNFDSFYITFPMWICVSVLWTYGIFSAIQGQTRPMPLVGGLYQKLLKNIS
ncbi:hypothetical protein [Flavobacterium sp. KACC 22761]|uniref:hypothetical protein n=1 Tax=Flavobacterium sp. KACC 22761 TaxID=3092665 RepID=UPI002A74F5F9|nr:hypothetical protein [Flavobacterium sp. KACC 22761]WPO77373.1 hypothetical protein SCB73_13975 [Flavobacterium sp. KACC 22761]